MGKITYNTQLVFQSESDKQKIIEMLEAQRFAWNECSKAMMTIPRNSIVDLHAVFYKKFRLSHPQTPSQVVISAEQSVLSAFRSIKSCKHEIDKSPEKKKLSIRLDIRTFSYKNGTFSIISLEKRVKCKPYIYKKIEEFLGKYKFYSPEIFERDGEIWINLTFEIPEIISQNKLALGIDLGCRVNAATSEGNLYIDKKFNGEKRKLRFLKRKLRSKADKGSKSARKHLKKLRRKEHNKNHNFTHHLTKKIIQDTQADTLVLENLKSLKVKKHKYQNKNRISQVPMSKLRRILTYKAPLYGKTVIEVCPSYTSQIDSQTGKKDGVRKGRRYYSKSGKIYDSDINGAINIGLRSKLPVSQTERLTYGQAIVNSPIVGVGRS